jgi:hypothetical protein
MREPLDPSCRAKSSSTQGMISRCLDVTWLPPPAALTTAAGAMAWHPRFDANAGHAWSAVRSRHWPGAAAPTEHDPPRAPEPSEKARLASICTARQAMASRAYTRTEPRTMGVRLQAEGAAGVGCL